jgi:hypothetical protein
MDYVRQGTEECGRDVSFWDPDDMSIDRFLIGTSFFSSPAGTDHPRGSLVVSKPLESSKHWLVTLPFDTLRNACQDGVDRQSWGDLVPQGPDWWVFNVVRGRGSIARISRPASQHLSLSSLGQTSEVVSSRMSGFRVLFVLLSRRPG